MILQSFAAGPFATNTYLLACPQTKKAALIDPAQGSLSLCKPSIQEHSLQVEKILLTHSHWDHIADLALAKEIYPAPLYVHSADAENVRHPGADGLPLLFPLSSVEPDHLLQGGEILMVGKIILEVIHTPGHSPGGLCFYLPQEQTLISGDTLFQGSIGNLSFPTADAEAMWQSLDRLSQLPPETKVYPGHGPATTIGAESWLPRAKQIFGCSA